MEPPLPIGASLSRADRLLLRLERRLEKTPDNLSRYVEFLRDYVTLKHMTKVESDSNSPSQKLYLSHHPVFKMTSSTTKLRVDFNALAPTTTGKSINDLQLSGPKLQSDLPLLLTRWRLYKYVYCADIAQMYRQILIHESDRYFQRMRWRFSPADKIDSFQLNTVTFGMVSSPYLAQRVLQQLAEDDGADYPLAVPIIRSGFYVDDWLFGSDDFESIQQIRRQVVALLKRGGFELRKWASNSPELLSEIPTENHGLALEREIKSNDSIKVLGLVWNPFFDAYRLSIMDNSFNVNLISKRNVLSIIAHLYDPLGWISPVIVQAKIFMQSDYVIIGHIVLLKQEHLPPTKWALGRVIAIHPGEDGLVRVVTVRTATTILKRPVVKLAALPILHDSMPCNSMSSSFV